MRRRTFMTGAAAATAAAILPDMRARALNKPAEESQGTTARSHAEFALANAGILARWTTDSGRFRYVALHDRISDAALPIPRHIFSLAFADGRTLEASDLTITSGPLFEPGGAVRLTLLHRSSGMRVRWRAIAPHDAAYLRQVIELEALDHPIPLIEVQLFDYDHLHDPYIAGTVNGSPLIFGRTFASVEHPLAFSEAIYDRGRASLARQVPLRRGYPLMVSSVLGVTKQGQLRRDFLEYLERERAHTYRPFLHYNSWYDLGNTELYDAAQCLNRIHTYGKEMHVLRGVTIKSMLFDDGWDDPNHLWQFNSGFPDGFAPLAAAAAAYGAAPGVWLSPFGGYGDRAARRVASGRRLGCETSGAALRLSGRKYFSLFEKTVERFVLAGGVNHFKFDGTAVNAEQVPDRIFDSDFEALIHLIERARQINPDLFVNVTTGSWPSPFWLRYCDSIWRGGGDHDYLGVGSQRQKWITYRDALTYSGIVVKGPLYPLNSLMLHGIIFGKHADYLSADPGGDFSSEVHSYFATGTQLQELYCSPDLLTNRHWDVLARWARWSAQNADILRDTHWIGGNPQRLEVYGWASWAPRKGIVTLRNPADQRQQFSLNAASAFELPDGAGQYVTASGAALDAHKNVVLTLEPFEVRTIEALPKR